MEILNYSPISKNLFSNSASNKSNTMLGKSKIFNYFLILFNLQIL